MKVLVTGGTGVIGEGLIPALLEGGHTVRLLTRGADEDARQWPDGVEAFAADVSSPETLDGAAEECEAVVHITGIVEESPPDVTFELVNVEGTRNMMREAERAGIDRFIFISSLGADRGKSEYHRSKLRAEEAVKSYPGRWLILRPGNVYGPGDEIISTLLKMIRSLPAVPIIDNGEQRFQPVWHEDLGKAILRAVEDDSIYGEALDLGGPDVTSMNDVIDRLSRITDRSPLRVPVPSFLASIGIRVNDITSLGSRLAQALGLNTPINESKLQMLQEENFIRKGAANGLTDVLGISPTPLDEGLKRLADQVPELLPTDGVGSLERKRFWADIENSDYSPEELLEVFRANCTEIMPIEFSAEPGAPQEVIEDATLTAALPLRGNIQIRVEEVSDRCISFATIEGHPLAGIVQFITDDAGRGVRFMVQIHARASNLFDLVAMRTVGSGMQRSNWEKVVAHMVELSGGHAPDGVQTEESKLDEQEAGAVEAEIKEMVNRRKRESAEGGKRAPVRAASETGGKQAIPDTVSGAIEGVMATANTAAEALARAATKIADNLNEKKR
jgi:NADH dehydrogenase